MNHSTGTPGLEAPVLPSAAAPEEGRRDEDARREDRLPPPAGRAEFRRRFATRAASAPAPAPAASTAEGASESRATPATADASAAEPALETDQRDAEMEREEAVERVLGRPRDPDLDHLTSLLDQLVHDLHRRGEAALEIQQDMATFEVTLRAYCRGYVDGRRGAREE